MKKVLIFTALFLFFTGAVHAPTSAQYEPNFNIATENIATNQYIIKFKDDKTPADIQSAVEFRLDREKRPLGTIQNWQENLSLRFRGEQEPEAVLETYQSVEDDTGVVTTETLGSLENTFVYITDGSENIQEVLSAYQNLPIEYIEPVKILHLDNIPNDTNYSALWGMQKISAEPAWDLTTGSPSVKVGVVDSGVDGTHPDLQANIVLTKQIGGDCPAQGDLVGHGTHVSGTIGGVGNNNRGVAGVNWTVGILGYCAGTNGLPMPSVIRAIDDAIQNGARVINMSFGGAGEDSTFTTFIQAHPNVLFIASAGNCGRFGPNERTEKCPLGGDTDGYYPSAYGETLNNVITVAATGPNNEWANYSSYGRAVTVTAPGGNPPNGSSTCSSNGSNCIYSTLPGGRYGVMAGTSMSGPHVTGLAALMLSKDSTLTPQRIKEIMSSTATDLGPSGRDDKFGAGLINVQAALNAIGANPPPANSPTPIPTTGQSTPPPTNPNSPTPSSARTTTGAPATPTPGNGNTNHPCPDKAALGNYDCNQVTDDNDRLAWEKDFKSGKAKLAPFFEWIRRALYKNS